MLAAIIIVATVMRPSAASADELRLKDGRLLVGEVEDDPAKDTLTIRTRHGAVEIPRRDVISVVKAETVEQAMRRRKAEVLAANDRIGALDLARDALRLGSGPTSEWRFFAGDLLLWLVGPTMIANDENQSAVNLLVDRLGYGRIDNLIIRPTEVVRLRALAEAQHSVVSLSVRDEEATRNVAEAQSQCERLTKLRADALSDLGRNPSPSDVLALMAIVDQVRLDLRAATDAMTEARSQASNASTLLTEATRKRDQLLNEHLADPELAINSARFAMSSGVGTDTRASSGFVYLLRVIASGCERRVFAQHPLLFERLHEIRVRIERLEDDRSISLEVQRLLLHEALTAELACAARLKR